MAHLELETHIVPMNRLIGGGTGITHPGALAELSDHHGLVSVSDIISECNPLADMLCTLLIMERAIFLQELRSGRVPMDECAAYTAAILATSRYPVMALWDLLSMITRPGSARDIAQRMIDQLPTIPLANDSIHPGVMIRRTMYQFLKHILAYGDAGVENELGDFEVPYVKFWHA